MRGFKLILLLFLVGIFNIHGLDTGLPSTGSIVSYSMDPDGT